MKLFFRHFGQGEPVIILHGLFGLSDNWVTIGKRLAGNFEVYIPDLRNHGQSPHSAVFNIPAMVEDLYDFTEEHRLKNINLIGHSLGGLVSMKFAFEYPMAVKKIIVVDIGLKSQRDHSDHEQLISAMLDVDFSRATKRSDVERQLILKIGSPKLRNFLLKNIYWRNKNTLDWRLNLNAISENLPLIYDGITDEGKFDGPALFIRGGLSSYINDEDTDGIFEKFPGARILTVPNATHWVHADAPGEFLEMVLRFLLPGEDW